MERGDLCWKNETHCFLEIFSFLNALRGTESVAFI